MSDAEAQRQAHNQIATLAIERERAGGVTTRAWRSEAAYAVALARKVGVDKEVIANFVEDRSILVVPV